MLDAQLPPGPLNLYPVRESGSPLFGVTTESPAAFGSCKPEVFFSTTPAECIYFCLLYWIHFKSERKCQVFMDLKDVRVDNNPSLPKCWGKSDKVLLGLEDLHPSSNPCGLSVGPGKSHLTSVSPHPWHKEDLGQDYRGSYLGSASPLLGRYLLKWSLLKWLHFIILELEVQHAKCLWGHTTNCSSIRTRTQLPEVLQALVV